MKMKIEDLKKLMIRVLRSTYYTRNEAEKIAEVLLYAELTGKNTQGIVKLLGTEPAQDIKPQYKPKILKKASCSFLIDGGGAAGPLPAQIATRELIRIVKKKGFGIAGMHNTFSSVGAISFYARKIAQEGLISIVAAGSPKAVLHFGGIDPVYGTNPIAFGFPTNEYPVVFDTAASAITWSGLVRAKALGEKLPDDVAVDEDGEITIDPEAAMKGAIQPFDYSYKGSGFAMVVELLTGPLTGASYVFQDGDWGTFFLAFSPDFLSGTGEFKKHASELIKKVKKSRVRSGQIIHIPGYDTEIRMQQRIKQGEIEIADELLQQLHDKTKK